MKSSITIAITIAAALVRLGSATMDDGVQFKAMQPAPVVAKRNAAASRMLHKKRDCDQNFGENHFDCGPGQQVICNHDTGQYVCKITNGAAACQDAGGEGAYWYTDSKGNVCCPFPCSDPSRNGCVTLNEGGTEKKDCD